MATPTRPSAAVQIVRPSPTAGSVVPAGSKGKPTTTGTAVSTGSPISAEKDRRKGELT